MCCVPVARYRPLSGRFRPSASVALASLRTSAPPSEMECDEKFVLAADLGLEGSYVECVRSSSILQLVMVHYRVIARHDLGDRVREILCAVRRGSSQLRCTWLPGPTTIRLRGWEMTGRRRRSRQNTSWIGSSTTTVHGDLDAGAIIEVSCVQRNKRTIGKPRNAPGALRRRRPLRAAESRRVPWKLLARAVQASSGH